MISLALALAAADPAPLSTAPFMDEPAAAKAFEAELLCLAHGAFDHVNDDKDAKLAAKEVNQSCHGESLTLRSALVDVFSRKRNLLPPQTTAEQAADLYVSQMNERTELVIEQGRRHR